MHPSLWTASSTNTIKKDSFKSKSSAAALNSLYTTFNIQEPPKTSTNDVTPEGSKRAVFTLESLFGSSQNTSLDGGSVGTDVSGMTCHGVAEHTQQPIHCNVDHIFIVVIHAFE